MFALFLYVVSDRITQYHLIYTKLLYLTLSQMSMHTNTTRVRATLKTTESLANETTFPDITNASRARPKRVYETLSTQAARNGLRRGRDHASLCVSLVFRNVTTSDRRFQSKDMNKSVKRADVPLLL